MCRQPFWPLRCISVRTPPRRTPNQPPSPATNSPPRQLITPSHPQASRPVDRALAVGFFNSDPSSTSVSALCCFWFYPSCLVVLAVVSLLFTGAAGNTLSDLSPYPINSFLCSSCQTNCSLSTSELLCLSLHRAGRLSFMRPLCRSSNCLVFILLSSSAHVPSSLPLHTC
jgi:hypothetical protein